MLKLLVGLVSIFGTQGYSSGATSCVTVGHGTFKTPIPTDWTLSLHDSNGNSVTTWSVGQTYTAQITATTTSFKGWLWAPLKGTPASFPAGSSNMAGTFNAGDSYSHSNTGCAGSITQTAANSRTTIKAIWTPPAAGTGTVSLWSMMVISKNGNNYNAILTVNEASVAGSPSPTAPAETLSNTLTPTYTGTGSGSEGSSATASSTVAASTTPSISVSVKNSPAAVYVAVPSAAPQQVIIQQSSVLSVIGIAVGASVSGAVVLAVVATVLHHVLAGRRRPISTMTNFNLPPPQIVTVNPLGSSPAC